MSSLGRIAINGATRRALTSMLDELHDHRHDAGNHDQDENDFNILLDERNIAEEVPGNRDTARPDKRTHAAEDQETAQVHAANAGNRSDEGADDWHKPRHHDRPGTVFVKERMGFINVDLLEQLAIGSAEERRARLGADPIADRVTSECRDDEEQAGKPDIEVDETLGNEQTRDEEQGIARQKESDQQAALGKNDGEDHPEGDVTEIGQQGFWIQPVRSQGRHEGGADQLKWREERG